jgi:hypothetical protein
MLSLSRVFKDIFLISYSIKVNSFIVVFGFYQLTLAFSFVSEKVCQDKYTVNILYDIYIMLYLQSIAFY